MARTKHIVEVAITTESERPVTKKSIAAFVEAAIGDCIEKEPALGLVESFRVRRVDID